MPRDLALCCIAVPVSSVLCCVRLAQWCRLLSLQGCKCLFSYFVPHQVLNRAVDLPHATICFLVAVLVHINTTPVQNTFSILTYLACYLCGLLAAITNRRLFGCSHLQQISLPANCRERFLYGVLHVYTVLYRHAVLVHVQSQFSLSNL